ncbi:MULTISPECIES: HIT family protein [Paenibacillus]|uniref:HIT family protein n=1 Tax=Paenibacillus TaxID=44249 RepID=UPI0022B8D353|nr:HIT family protein [Paenibacillus caseinilyticus]MCZ8522713.1 HIT family protein [Paenibacillus caseinilyticus]
MEAYLPACLGCRLANGGEPAEVVYEDEQVTCLLDIAPLHGGHVLILPKAHALDLDELEQAALLAVAGASVRIAKALKAAYAPDGITTMSNGGIFNDLGHVHLHVFPRYEGDEFGWREPSRPRGTELSAPKIRERLAEAISVL